MTSTSPEREKWTSRILNGGFVVFFSSSSRQLADGPGLTCSSVSETTTFVVSFCAIMYRRPSGLVSTLLTVNPGRSNTTPQFFVGKERLAAQRLRFLSLRTQRNRVKIP